MRVLALERPLPPLAALRALPDRGPAARVGARGSRAAGRDASTWTGSTVRYVRFLSPPRPLSYGELGALGGAAAAAGRSTTLAASGSSTSSTPTTRCPAGDAALRWLARRGGGSPLVVSVHGGDLTYAAPRSERGRRAVGRTLAGADAVIVNSALTRRGVEELTGPREGVCGRPSGRRPDGAAPRRPPTRRSSRSRNLEPHKSQADVIRALAPLAPTPPGPALRAGRQGPAARGARAAGAPRSGVADRVALHRRAAARARRWPSWRAATST